MGDLTLAAAIERLATVMHDVKYGEPLGERMSKAMNELPAACEAVLDAAAALAQDSETLVAMLPYGIFMPARWIENHVPERLSNQMLTRIAELLPGRLKFATELRQAALQARGGA